MMIDTVSKFKFLLCLKDNTASWVRIVNGVDTYVTESMLSEKEEETASVKPIAKARPREKPTVTLISVSILVPERLCSSDHQRQNIRLLPHLHVNVQRHYTERTFKHSKM